MNYRESNTKKLSDGPGTETRQVSSAPYKVDNDLNAFGDYTRLTRVAIRLEDFDLNVVFLNEDWFLETDYLPRRELKLTREQAAECLKNFFVQQALAEK